MKKSLLSLVLALTFSALAWGQTTPAPNAAQKHEEMMAAMFAPPKIPLKTIGILLYPGFNVLDAMGPYYVLSQLMGVKVFFVAPTKGLVPNQSGVKVWVDTAMAQVKQLDMLLIPGGARETFLMTQDSGVLAWIRAIDRGSTITSSVCTGAWILGASGVLQGKKVSANWYRAKEIMALYGADYQSARWVQDGKYWTSAGVTAGIDMALAIVNVVRGDQYAKGIMIDMEYDPAPPFDPRAVQQDQQVVDFMREMYDLGLLPLFKELKKH